MADMAKSYLRFAMAVLVLLRRLPKLWLVALGVLESWYFEC
jgi:hypothetical protein